MLHVLIKANIQTSCQEVEFISNVSMTGKKNYGKKTA